MPGIYHTSKPLANKTFSRDDLELNWKNWLNENFGLTYSREGSNLQTGDAWAKSLFHQKRSFQKLWFPRGVHYDEQHGFWIETGLLPGFSIGNPESEEKSLLV